MDNSDGSLRISWWGAQDKSGSPYLMYNVYASTQTPVDISDARNLVARRVVHPQLSLSKDDGQHSYAVTAVDRYGNESDAIQSHQTKQKSKVQWLHNDGRNLEMPPRDSTIEYDYLNITNMAGNVMTIRAMTDKSINIRTLPNGVYNLNAVDRHKHARRIGQFMVKRDLPELEGL